MGQYNYSAKDGENSAKAVGRSLPISTKYSVETLNMIRNKSLARAKKMLEEVIVKKRAVALKIYFEEVPHKKGMASGAYPVKACKHILKLIKSAEANAQFKGLNTAKLVIKHACAHRGPTTPHHGRHRGNAKKTHVEIILQESAKKQDRKVNKKKSPMKKENKATEKKETKPAVKKEESKATEKKEEVKATATIKEEKAVEEKKETIKTKAPKEESKAEEKPAQGESKSPEVTQQ